MGIDLSTILAVITGVFAAFFIVLEQWKSKKPWKSLRLWLAFAFLAVTILTIVVQSITTKALDRERQADLLLIQKQNAALNSLCFELHLQPYDHKYNKGCDFQIQTYSRVVARIVRSGLIAEYIHFQFHPDTGWFRSSGYVQNWPSMKLEYDSTNHTVRFEMTPFGIRSQSQGVLLWKAERLVDLAQVRFEIQMSYGIDLPPRYYPPDLNWSPVRSIYLYANSYEPENLITRLQLKERSYGDIHDVAYFHPEGQPVKDYDNFNFYIDLLQMRSHILKSLNSTK